MRCLFAVSSLFVQRASLTVNIGLSYVTNIYSTVPYRTVAKCRFWYMRKKIDHCSVVPEKKPTLGSTIQRKTRQASLPTGMVGPRVRISLSPLNTNDGFYLSYIGKTTEIPIWCARIHYKDQMIPIICHLTNLS